MSLTLATIRAAVERIEQRRSKAGCTYTATERAARLAAMYAAGHPRICALINLARQRMEFA